MHQGAKIINWLYLFSLALLLVALPLSKYLMSVAQFFLAGVFILDGISRQEVAEFLGSNTRARATVLFIPTGIKWVFAGIYRKFKDFFHRENIPAVVFSSIYLLHIVGLFFTVDFSYALKDLRIKFPIFLLPLVLSTTGILDRRIFRWLMYLFIAAVITSTLVSMYLYLTREATDIRDISIFISHIRFSLLIDIAIFVALYLILKKDEIWKWQVRLVLSLSVIWMVIFLYISASMTGLAIFIITAIFMIFIFLLQHKSLWIKGIILAGISALIVVISLYISRISEDVYHVEPVDFSSLDKATVLGNPYQNDTANLQVENGHYVWLYINQDELRQAWNHRSGYSYDGKDKAGQELRYTLIRFLTSKGYRKDAEGVNKLTDEEIAYIEDGVASTVYVDHPGVYVRVYKIIWEYKRYVQTHNPSGHSVMQRIEYWRAAWGIIRGNWLTGVGTGDMNAAFQNQYIKMGSLLDEEFRWRSHNQFLAIFVGFGVFGLAWFLFAMLFPPIRLGKFPDYYYLTFFIIIILSMITEDTIESQAGVTIFAFFTSFYLFAKKFIDLI